MNILVDTSVWSLALRRDHVAGPHAEFLNQALNTDENIFTTGLILQELLQGFAGPANRNAILGAFDALPLIVPVREDHVAAAKLRNECRRKGVQTGTIDALIASLCISRKLMLLSADADFEHIARVQPLLLWIPASGQE